MEQWVSAAFVLHMHSFENQIETQLRVHMAA